MKVQLLRQFKWHISFLLTISAALHDQENTSLLEDSRVNSSGEGVNLLSESSFQAGRIQNDIQKLSHEIIAALRDKNIQLKNLSIEKTILQNLYDELLQRHECLKKQHEGTLSVIETQKGRLSALDSLNKDLTEENRNVSTKLLNTENLLNRLKIQNYSLRQEIKTSIQSHMSTILTRHMDQIKLHFFQTNQKIDAQLHQLCALKQYLNENKSKLKIGLYNDTNGRKHTFCQTDPELIKPSSMNPKQNQFTHKHHHHQAVADQKSIMHKLHSIIKMLKQINSMNTNSIDKDNSIYKSIDKAFNIQQNIDTLEQTEQLLNMINSHSNQFMSTGNKSMIYDNQKVPASSSLHKCIGKRFYNLKTLRNQLTKQAMMPSKKCRTKTKANNTDYKDRDGENGRHKMIEKSSAQSLTSKLNEKHASNRITDGSVVNNGDSSRGHGGVDTDDDGDGDKSLSVESRPNSGKQNLSNNGKTNSNNTNEMTSEHKSDELFSLVKEYSNHSEQAILSSNISITKNLTTNNSEREADAITNSLNANKPSPVIQPISNMTKDEKFNEMSAQGDDQRTSAPCIVKDSDICLVTSELFSQSLSVLEGFNVPLERNCNNYRKITDSSATFLIDPLKSDIKCQNNVYAYCADYVTSKPLCDNDISLDHLSSTSKIVSSIDIPCQHRQDNSESNLSYDIAEAYSTVTCQLVVDEEKKNASVAVVVVGTEGGEEKEEEKSGERVEGDIFQINNPLIVDRTNQLAEMNSIETYTNDTIASVRNKLSDERNARNIYQYASSEINRVLVNIIERVKQNGDSLTPECIDVVSEVV
ncbi:unnamed protein product [Trichobilharzia szidati]|nr:unnamed protein product [Trichobilharzia szidati]